MNKTFAVGNNVFFLHKGEIRYLRIMKITEIDGVFYASFGSGCACSKITKPLNELYTTVEELKKEMNR